MIFARIRQNFLRHLPEKDFFPKFWVWGNRCPLPVSYAYAYKPCSTKSKGWDNIIVRALSKAEDNNINRLPSEYLISSSYITAICVIACTRLCFGPRRDPIATKVVLVILAYNSLPRDIYQLIQSVTHRLDATPSLAAS